MAKPIRIIVHCTGEPSNAVRDRDYYFNLFFKVYKWKHWGYHAIVYQDGSWEILQPLPILFGDSASITSATMANGAQGYNHDSLHIAYVGGLTPTQRKPADTRTIEQRETLWVLIAKWKLQYGITDVLGHSQLPYVNKACPCFDARKEYAGA